MYDAHSSKLHDPHSPSSHRILRARQTKQPFLERVLGVRLGPTADVDADGLVSGADMGEVTVERTAKGQGIACRTPDSPRPSRLLNREIFSPFIGRFSAGPPKSWPNHRTLRLLRTPDIP